MYQVKQHPYFNGFKWEELINLNFDPPYLPEVKSLNFSKYESLVKYCDENSDLNELKNFSREEVNKVDLWWKQF